MRLYTIRNMRISDNPEKEPDPSAPKPGTWAATIEIVDIDPYKWFLLDTEYNYYGKKYLQDVARRIRKKKYAGLHKYKEYSVKIVTRTKKTRYGRLDTHELWVKRDIAKENP